MGMRARAWGDGIHVRAWGVGIITARTSGQGHGDKDIRVRAWGRGSKVEYMGVRA